MQQFFRIPPSPDATWLDAVLHDVGVLRGGRVVSLEQRANAAFNSQIVHRDYWWPKMQCVAAAYQEWCL
jgi:hypothetical protein